MTTLDSSDPHNKLLVELAICRRNIFESVDLFTRHILLCEYRMLELQFLETQLNSRFVMFDISVDDAKTKFYNVGRLLQQFRNKFISDLQMKKLHHPNSKVSPDDHPLVTGIFINTEILVINRIYTNFTESKTPCDSEKVLHWCRSLSIIFDLMSLIIKVIQPTKIVTWQYEKSVMEEYLWKNCQKLTFLSYEYTQSPKQFLEEWAKNFPKPTKPTGFNVKAAQKYLQDKWDEIYFADDTVFHKDLLTMSKIS